ncbi:alanine racemase [Williamsia herbipolensis]|uniref:alanine racemase n=1 Tax=Williamsia herbipolensis TaxID=1603258 RepID=UPI0005F86F0C|nr:alanine racemase [Williamsia herbipolensis]
MPTRPPLADTPYVRVDTGVLEANIATMATRVAAQGLALRPHAKTHKCADIARRQIASGAVGLTVATIGEAQAFAAAGFDDLFIAYPLWLTASKAERLRSVAHDASLRVAVDSVAGAIAMAQALGDARESVEVLVEVDSGQHRTGTAPADAGIVAAQAVAHGLRVVGVFTFPGHGYSPAGRESAAHQEARAISDAADALASVGVDPIVRSGGSTPTVEFAHPDVLTEVRPGVYPFNDAQQVALGRAGLDDVSLSVAATVIRREPGRAVLDCGSKILGSEKPDWVPGFGLLPDLPDARIVALSEHHATVVSEGRLPDAGSVVRVVPNHVCITVNLVDDLVAVTDAGEVGRWPLLARGANS